MRTTIATSDPSQCALAPSAPQNMPKPVSMMSTVNLIGFSGTRASGSRTSDPVLTGYRRFLAFV
jgi:hypothetical protein